MKSNHIILIAVASVFTIALRLIEIPAANFGSMLALSLLCGFVIRSPWGCLIPLAVRLITDVALEAKTGYGFWGSWYMDYAAYLLIAILGRRMFNWQSLKPVATAIAGVAVTALLAAGTIWFLKTDLPDQQKLIVQAVAQCSFAFVACYAVVMLWNSPLLQKVFAATAGSIVIYFLISNFGAWLYAPESYERSLAGLLKCYTMGIPFVRSTVIGNLVFAPVFFTAWNLLAETVPNVRIAAAEK